MFNVDLLIVQLVDVVRSQGVMVVMVSEVDECVLVEQLRHLTVRFAELSIGFHFVAEVLRLEEILAEGIKFW